MEFNLFFIAKETYHLNLFPKNLHEYSFEKETESACVRETERTRQLLVHSLNANNDWHGEWEPETQFKIPF